MRERVDDRSASFAALRSGLKSESGVSYLDFLRTLKPSYLRVWLDIAAGYAILAGAIWAEVTLQRALPGLWWLIVPAFTGILGYFINYLFNFVHEANHYNLASGKRLNDLLGTLFLGLLIGQTLPPNRKLHFEHHRNLGTPEDVENSYFYALTPRYIVRSLTGLRTLDIMRGRSARGRAKGRSAPSALGLVVLALGGLIHLSIVLGAVWSGAWWVALSWSGGMLLVFPFLAALRTILEHRDLAASGDIDYSAHPHGAVTRIFGDGPLASTLGSAGFNRHLLHHWEPQISYTQLRRLEHFLATTQVGELIRARRASYIGIFVALMRASGRRAGDPS